MQRSACTLEVPPGHRSLGLTCLGRTADPPGPRPHRPRSSVRTTALRSPRPIFLLEWADVSIFVPCAALDESQSGVSNVAWLSLTPDFVVALVYLFVPGLLVARTLGLRGIFLLAAAPALSVAIAGGSAVLAQLVGLRWNMVSAGLGTLLAIAAAVAVTRLLPQLGRQPQVRPTDPDATFTFFCAGAAAALVSSRLMWAIGSPQAIAQTHDNLFHLNAVRYIVESGRGSSLTLGWLGTRPGLHYYPAAWHDFVSLVITSTNASLPAGINITNVVVAAVVWPLGCMALAVSAAGRRQLSVAIGALLATAFSIYPYFLFNFGVIYPWLLAVSVTPVILALIIGSVRAEPSLPRDPAILVAVLAYLGLFVVHPGVAVPLLALIGAVLIPAAGGLIRRRRLVGISCVAAYCLITTSAWIFLRPARVTNWDSVGSVAVGVLQALLLAPLGDIPAVLALTLWICLVAAIRDQRLRWTLPLFAVVVLLEGVTQWSSHPTLKWILAGVWYGDPFRPATLLPVAAIPVMVVGLSKVWDRYRSRTRGADSLGARIVLPLMIIVFVGGLVADPGMLTTLRQVHRGTAVDDHSALLTRSELTLLKRLPGQVPSGTAVAGNPATGTSLAYALEDVRVVEPFNGLPDGPAGKKVMDSLDSMTTDPSVCPAVRMLNVGYVLDFSGRRIDAYQPLGLRDLTPSRGFALVDQEGRSRLFKVTGCPKSNP
jgi:hypothetical protein